MRSFVRSPDQLSISGFLISERNSTDAKLIAADFGMGGDGAETSATHSFEESAFGGDAVEGGCVVEGGADFVGFFVAVAAFKAEGRLSNARKHLIEREN